MGHVDAKGNLAIDELRIEESLLKSIDKIIVIACGTAAYAGHVARYAIEHWCRIPTEVELAHEFRYRDPIVNEKTLVVALSQSGEDRKSTRLNSSHVAISYAVFCLKKKKTK